MNLTHDTTSLGVVADIGGTNARLGLVANSTPTPQHILVLPTNAYRSLTALIEDYLARLGIQRRPEQACIAIAGPIHGDECRLTNLPLRFSIEQTQQELELTRLEVINDFDAIARYVPHLNGDDTLQVGRGRLNVEHAKVVIGPGTGLGVAALIPLGDSWGVPGEGGHAPAPTLTDREFDVLRTVRDQAGQVARPGSGTCRSSNRPGRLRATSPSGCSRSLTPSSTAPSTGRPGRRPATSRPKPSRWPS